MDLKKIEFKEVDNSDFDEILNLVYKSFDADPSIVEEDLRSILESPKTHGKIYGIWYKDTLIATVAYGRYYSEKWKGEGGISHLAVNKKFRRKGLGTQIIKQAISDLKEAGAPCIAVAIKVGNKVALKMWKQHGFKLYDPAYNAEGYGTYEGYVLWF